jgi:3D (Asp-Asp-Asp) domain-containing protein
MGIHRSQFDLPRLAIITLAAPVVFYTLGLDGVVMARQQPELRQSQEASLDLEKVDSNLELDRQLRRLIIEDIHKVLLDKEAKETIEKVEEPEPIESPKETFVATAYSIKNLTACGVMVRPGIIAADPRVLPLGSIVKIEAGKYSGTYRVLDTGPAIRGRRLDIYMTCRGEAITFGRRKVQLEILRWGWGTQDEEQTAEGQ